jgi:hypothetical protein
MPVQFAYPAAFGDLLAAVLALIAIPAVATQARLARLLVWVFNVVGTLDLILAITLSTIYAAAPFMGPAYWTPAFSVPALRSRITSRSCCCAGAGPHRNVALGTS